MPTIPAPITAISALRTPISLFLQVDFHRQRDQSACARPAKNSCNLLLRLRVCVERVDQITFSDLHPVKRDVVRTSTFSASARYARAKGGRPFQFRRRDTVRATGNARAGDAPCRSLGTPEPS